jgi:hypothetical protein
MKDGHFVGSSVGAGAGVAERPCTVVGAGVGAVAGVAVGAGAGAASWACAGARRDRKRGNDDSSVVGMMLQRPGGRPSTPILMAAAPGRSTFRRRGGLPRVHRGRARDGDTEGG